MEPTKESTSTGLAMDAAGNLLDLPRDLAHSISHDLTDVVTLLHAAMRENEYGDPHGTDRDRLTNVESRVKTLLRMADEKVREAIFAMDPFV